MEILLYLFIIAAGFLITNFLFYCIAFISYRPSSQKAQTFEPVSVIIAARDEALNLHKNLPKILNQDYPDFEVIVINDQSTDNSSEILEGLKKQHSRLKVIETITLNKISNKKKAIEMGIQEASSEYLLFTDADCRPNSNKWISSMMMFASSPPTIVLGYGGYERESSLLNKLIRYETIVTAIQSFSWAKINRPYMGVGRNLLYNKGLFAQVNGFSRHSEVLSGDDDLFVQDASLFSRTYTNLSPDSFTYSSAKTRLAQYINQKRRHITTSPYYRGLFKIWLGTLFFSYLAFWGLGIALFVLDFQLHLLLAIVIIKFLVQSIIVIKASQIFKERDLILLFPLLEFVLIAFQLYIFILNLINKPKSWS
ncbi:MAG: glycosyltransferase [Flavobacteriaceae bacterium]|nr:glycosyltransferase [Flavobacteriaceae bacterium]